MTSNHQAGTSVWHRTNFAYNTWGVELGLEGVPASPENSWGTVEVFGAAQNSHI